MNNCSFVGRFTADPELHKAGENSVTSFSFAIDRDYKDKEGNRVTDFINFVAWRGTAEFTCKYFHKGDMAAVTGELNSRKYTDKEGNKRNAYEVVVRNIDFCGGKKDNASTNTKQESNKSENTIDVSDDDDSALPF